MTSKKFTIWNWLSRRSKYPDILKNLARFLRIKFLYSKCKNIDPISEFASGTSILIPTLVCNKEQISRKGPRGPKKRGAPKSAGPIALAAFATIVDPALLASSQQGH